jgi:hypothetical protein
MFGLYIDAAGRIIPHQNHRQTGRTAKRTNKGRHHIGNALAQIGGKGFAINNLGAGWAV